MRQKRRDRSLAHSPIDQGQRPLVFIDRMIERDKIHAPVWAPPVEVRNLQIDFESLREGVQLDVICFFFGYC